VPDEPYCLSLDNLSKELFHSFRLEIERELRPDGRLFTCLGWGGKIAGYTLRLAGLMHVAEHSANSHHVIQSQTMSHAIQLARLLMDHTIAAYHLMCVDTEAKDAKELFEWLKARKQYKITKSEILIAFRNRQSGKKERLNKAIKILQDRHMLSALHADYSTRKPTDVFFINQEIFNEPLTRI
jgi:hypothetical protein